VTSLSGQSGLIVVVPEAEAAVGRHRDRLDASAGTRRANCARLRKLSGWTCPSRPGSARSPS